MDIPGGDPQAASRLDPVGPDEKWFQERRREVIVLMMRFLMDHGYGKTYESLCQETQMNLGQMSTADNIDLVGIVQEYILYFRHKFGKPPILIRPVQPPSLHEARPDMRPMPGRPELQGRLPQHMRLPVAAPPPPPLGGLLPSQSARLAANGRMMLPPANSQPATSPPVGIELTTPATFVLGSVQPCTQEQLVATVQQALQQQQHHPPDLTAVLSFYRPKKTRLTPSKRSASSTLELNDLQEDILYALVGCEGVGWSIRNVHPSTRTWLQESHAVDKELLQLFYKNRAPKRRREDGYGGPVQ